METQNIPGPKSGEGQTHPRVTPDAIAANIVSTHYFTAYEGVIGEKFHHQKAESLLTVDDGGRIPTPLKLLTFCVIILRNGFTVVGQSACASPENYSQSIGETVAHGDAIRQIWPLMGYELRSQLALAAEAGRRNGIHGQDNLGEALTHMVAHRLGNPEAFTAEHAETILAHFKDENEKAVD